VATGLLLTLILASDLEATRQAFELGDCTKVIKGASTALTTVTTRGGRGEVHRMAAICYFRSGRHHRADTHARAALRLNPGHSLDPFLSPPKERTWFDRLVAEVPPPKPQVVERVVTVVNQVHHRRCFVPFGYCHWQQKDYSKAVALSSAQFLGLSLNVLGYWGATQQVAANGMIHPDDNEALYRWTAVQYAGAVIAIGSAGLDLFLARGERSDAVSPPP
jgi:hypothetical protein